MKSRRTSSSSGFSRTSGNPEFARQPDQIGRGGAGDQGDREGHALAAQPRDQLEARQVRHVLVHHEARQIGQAWLHRGNVRRNCRSRRTAPAVSNRNWSESRTASSSSTTPTKWWDPLCISLAPSPRQAIASGFAGCMLAELSKMRLDLGQRRGAFPDGVARSAAIVIRTSSGRFRTPIFSITLARCTSTVRGLEPRS